MRTAGHLQGTEVAASIEFAAAAASQICRAESSAILSASPGQELAERGQLDRHLHLVGESPLTDAAGRMRITAGAPPKV